MRGAEAVQKEKNKNEKNGQRPKDRTYLRKKDEGKLS